MRTLAMKRTLVLLMSLTAAVGLAWCAAADTPPAADTAAAPAAPPAPP
jgi:hypothetical protein